MTETIGAAAGQLAEDVLDTVSALRRALRRRTGPSPGALTDAQRELVRLVRRRPGVSVGDAAAELRLAPNTVSTLVGSLSATGWLRRAADSTDARLARLHLSAPASSRLAAWRDRRLGVIEDAVGELSRRERESIAAALPLLQRVVDRMDASA